MKKRLSMAVTSATAGSLAKPKKIIGICVNYGSRTGKYFSILLLR
jgi:hypothetical protein